MKKKDFFDIVDKENTIIYHALSSKIAVVSNDFKLNNIIEDKLYEKFPDLNNYQYFENERKIGEGRIDIKFMSACDCNMQCKYCFAEGGSYASKKVKPKIMSKELYIETLKFFLDKYKEGVGEVTFFGGEPLLGYKEIYRLIPEVISFYELRKKCPPSFIISTNATLLNEEIVQFMHKYNIIPAISLDGPEEINDSARMFKDGSGGTYHRVLAAIQILKKYKISFYLQVVLNRKHVENFENLEDLEWIEQLENLGAEQINFLPVTTNINEYTLEGEELVHKYDTLIRNITNYYLHKLITPNCKVLGDKMITPLIYMLQNKIKYECNAGYSVFVDTDGTIYPCQMYCGFDNFNIGNVWKGTLNKERILRLRSVNRQDNEECMKCIAKGVCLVFCKGLHWLMKGDVRKVCDVRCIFQRAITEECIKTISRIKKGTTEYKVFLENVCRIFSKQG